LNLSTDPLAERTYFWERVRSVFTGVIEVVWQPGAAVALLVAIRYYDGDVIHKGVISGAKAMGFLFAPLTLSLFAHSRQPITRVMAGILGLTGLILLAVPWSPGLMSYMILVSLGSMVMAQYLPMNTEMYGTHFTTGQRGHRIGTVFIIGCAVSAATQYLTGAMLDARLDLFRGFMVVAALCCFASAFCLLKIPSRPLNPEHVGHPWKNIGLVWKDRLFGWLLSSWMLLGIGNLMTLPLRVEYMADPRFGIDASNRAILLVTGAVPLISRLFTTRWLGILFDRWNLVTLRMFLNSLFALSMLFFFNTKNIWVMGASMAVLGAAMAGGRISWTLWVTKLTPPDKTSAYMSVHMFSTGIRGSFAPFLGFALIERFTIFQVSLAGIALTLLSTLMFLPARKYVARRGVELEAVGRPV
jgi:hypothetical protein